MFLRALLLISILCSFSVGQEKAPLNFGWSPPKEGVVYKSSNHPIRINNLIENDDEEGEGDAYLLYRPLFQVLKKNGQLTEQELSSGRIDSLNQSQVGSCVGYATTICLDILASNNQINKPHLKQKVYNRFSPDAIYGIIRSKHLSGQDGAIGAWIGPSLNDFGTINRTIYKNGLDFRNTIPQDGRKWAREGMPNGSREIAVEHRVLSYEQVKTIEQARLLIKNGYPINTCALSSYSVKRDNLGFARRTGRDWAHSMAIIGYRNSKTGRAGFLVQNSWKADEESSWNGGPIWPPDMSKGSFWITEDECAFQLGQNDSWAFSDYEGFKRRVISWKAVFYINEDLDEK